MSDYREPDRAHLQEEELAAIYEADLEKERAQRKARDRRTVRIAIVGLAALAVLLQFLFAQNFAENGLTVNGWAPPAVFIGFIFAIGLLSNWGTLYFQRKRKDFSRQKLEADAAAFLAKSEEPRLRVAAPPPAEATSEPHDESEAEAEDRKELSS